MKYMLMICSEESRDAAMTEAEVGSLMEVYGRFHQEAESKGVHLQGARLQPTSTATCVRVRNGKVLTTDGPFAETKEQVGGYYLLEAKDLDEALAWAARIPSAQDGTVEVRPLWIMGEE